MKTTGTPNIGHLIPWNGKHVVDGKKQELQKPGIAKYRARSKRRALNRRARKKARKEDFGPEEMEDVGLEPNAAKFPIGRGIFVCSYEPLGPAVDGRPLRSIWLTYGLGDTALVLKWRAELGRWHAGYPSAAKGNKGAMKPEFFLVSLGGTKDMRFIEGTLSLPRWDSEALSAAWKAGEVSSGDFDDLLLKVRERLADGEFERLASCHAPRYLKLIGLVAHPQDGVLHIHPVFLKTKILAFLKADGRLLPADHKETPKGGRRRTGEGWVGGERLGLIGNGGKLITNTLGPAGCATSAEREVEIPPGLHLGDNWDQHDRTLESRLGVKADGKASSLKGQEGRARQDGLGECFDDYGSRVFREEVAKLAERNAAFRVRRKAAIAKAVADRLADNRALVWLVAGKAIAELEKANGALRVALKNSEDAKAAPPLELTGQLEVGDGESVPVLLAPNYLKMWLREAIGLLLKGRSLGSMSAQARQAVEIKPSTGSSGGRVGLTTKALRLVEKAIFELDTTVSGPATAQATRDSAQNALKAFRAVEAANNASLGIPEGDKGKVSPVFDPEQLVIWLGEATALVLDGRDLSSMSALARLAVEIKPSTGLTACRVGLTGRALLFVETAIVELESFLKGSVGNPVEVNRVSVVLGAFREAIDAHRHHMGEVQPKDLPLVTDPVKLIEYLSHANVLAKGGYDLSSMPPEALAAVEIKAGGRVGLTGRQLRFVQEAAAESLDAMVATGATPTVIKEAKARLLAFRRVLLDNDASEGVGKQAIDGKVISGDAGQLPGV